MTSTKKQKMTISRKLVDKVHNEFNPPGRFLEKNAETGAWHEVDDKRALEKTAQTLRDYAAPLRKKMAKEGTDSGFLDALVEGSVASGKSLPKQVSDIIPFIKVIRSFHCMYLIMKASSLLIARYHLRVGSTGEQTQIQLFLLHLHRHLEALIN